MKKSSIIQYSKEALQSVSDEIITLSECRRFISPCEFDSDTKGGRLTLRRKSISRATAETSIDMDFAIDGTGETIIETGVGFFDHMLTLFTKHGLFDL